jgi:hypothetical protein
MLAEVSARAGARAGEIPGISFDVLFQSVIMNFGLLLVVGIVAATVYGRFKMKM